MKCKYHGITHFSIPFIPRVGDNWFTKLWEKHLCKRGLHLLDEVWSIDEHILVCDICELEVHIEKIVERKND